MTREEMLTRKIAVLYGGLSSERNVSLETGAAIHNALLARGYNAVLLDQQRDLAQQLTDHQIEIAFLALHGRYGEDGAVQGLLEVMGIPYTGSKVLASAVAMDKHIAKLLFSSQNLPVADWILLEKQKFSGMPIELPFDYPAVIKPNASGSSVGVKIVQNETELDSALQSVFQEDSYILIEKYCSGMEISVTVLDGKAIGIIWIKPSGNFYDYEAKYLVDSTEYIYPAPLPEDVYRMCMAFAENAHRAVRAQGVTRTDMIVGEDGSISVIEINTMPGMTSHSLVPKTARGEGISFEQLCERILLGASLELSSHEETAK